MDDNSRPLEHFNFLFFLQDGQRAENMHKQNRQSVHHPRNPIPPPQPPLYSPPLSLLCRVKGKGSEKAIHPEERSHRNSQALTFKVRGGGHDWLPTWVIARSHIFVLFVVIWYIIFCLFKTGPRKTTQHITSFLFVLFFLTKTWGEETTFLHSCLLQKCYKMFLYCRIWTPRPWNLSLKLYIL